MNSLIFQIKKAIRKIAPEFVLNYYHFLLAWIAAVRYGFPAQKLKVIGVTGTNGKSTTVEMIAAILKEADQKIALSSSIRFEVGGESRKNNLNNSMPGPFYLQRLLAEAVSQKCDWAIIEVTSEGIKQHRHRFINFWAAVFTNLTPEHIESHGSFENYRAEKLKLFFGTSKYHIINLDDKNYKFFLDVPAEKIYCYSIQDKIITSLPPGTTLIRGSDITVKNDGTAFSVNGMNFFLALPGVFNISNALAAISLAISQGITLAVCQRALRQLNVLPGRMEQVWKEPAVFVDYAFTPNALEQVYDTLKKRAKADNGQLICLLGACGGGRDKWKRPVLGQIAAHYCDKIILTNEDPFDEDPWAIIKAIADGVQQAGFAADNIFEIADRKEAIRRALELARAQDAVVLTGKGCEPWIRLKNGKKIDWNEKAIVLELAQQLKKDLNSKG